MVKAVLVLSVATGAFALAAVPLVAQQAPPVTFLRDVAPILNRVGCTAGACHGAAKGKNGFKLSLRGYDPRFDYEALLYDLAGRRFNRADPGRSLMLAKPSQEVAHGGGRRFAKDSDYYKTIYNWISQGIRIFRVDNPHTKPFPFWEGLIREIRRLRPDVIFLAEAFTRPKVMYRLAK